MHTTKIINKILDNGTCTEHFKRSIIPIYKKGDVYDMSNYRPTSLLSNFSKICEKVMKAWMVSYLEKYELISTKQFGFRNGRSTQGALNSLNKKICESMDENKRSLCLSLI